MTELQTKAKDYILSQCVPDSLLDIIEFFDYDLDDDDAIEVYELIVAAKVAVRWD